MDKRKALIIGAGPAGLTAAWELLNQTDVLPVIYEASSDIGGIARTVNYKGNRIDIGGHRFFSKSDWVMNWWRGVLPLQGAPSRDDIAMGRQLPLSTEPGAPNPEVTDEVMLVRSRLSRIFYLRKFFDYPISLCGKTLKNLGLARTFGIGMSYMRSRISPIKPEKSLEDFIINRFGRALYRTFFQDYTEKVWGVGPANIKSNWGAQRIKGLSISRVLGHAIKSMFKRDKSVDQKNTETSLIGQFLYPKFGPGQLWNEAAKRVLAKGGQIHMEQTVTGVVADGGKVTGIRVRDNKTGQERVETGDFVISTMTVKDLVAAMGPAVPAEVAKVAGGLVYRDFMTVGLLMDGLKVGTPTAAGAPILDNWIYVQERDVKLGRVQVFNNWSPYLVSDPKKVWLGLEYFVNSGDNLWNMDDRAFVQFSIDEMVKIGMIDKQAVRDSVVLRVPNTYPAYFGSYDQFDVIRKFVDRFENLFLVGRGGMHRYNNMDHSMLTALAAVQAIAKGDCADKQKIWSVNAEEEYHEEKSSS